MLERKIIFVHMAHTEAIEAHANQHLDKLEKLLDGTGLPQSIEIHLKCQPHGKHHEVEAHLNSKIIKADAKSSNPEMYIALDETIHKIIDIVKKHRGKQLDMAHKPQNPDKADFYNQD